MTASQNWSRIVHGLFGTVYTVCVVAALYGFVSSDSRLVEAYGAVGNYAILSSLLLGGSTGMYSYITNKLRVELLAAPLVCLSVVLTAPAIFYWAVSHGQGAWMGWLLVAFGVGMVTRWADIQRIMAERRSGGDSDAR